MKTKIVYVMVSDASDYYLEQSIISASSTRYWNPTAHIIVVMDDITSAAMEGSRENLLNFIDEKLVVSLPAEMGKKQRSRVLKTSLRDLIEGDFLYIDSDTVVCAPLDEIDSFSFPIGAVLDRHCYIDQIRDYKLAEQMEILGGKIVDGEEYYNGGVFYVKDLPITHSFFKEWGMLYSKGVSGGMFLDQPPLLECNHRFRLIHLMEGIYNCQLFLGGLPYLANAKIIHAFNVCGSTSFFLFADSSFFKKIRLQGHTFKPDDYEKIKNPKSQFKGEYKLSYGADILYERSVLYHLFLQNYSLFKILEFFGKVVLRVVKFCSKKQ